MSDESGQPEIYLQSWPATGLKKRISNNGGTEPAWNLKGGELFYREGSKMMAVLVETDPALKIGNPHKLFEGNYRSDEKDQQYTVHPDGDRFLMIANTEEWDHAHIEITFNWFEELERLVSTGK